MSRWEGKYVIGLTGNIGVGKSVVRQMLQHLGAYTIDADELTHQVMAPGAPAHQPVIEMFGRVVLDEQGRINRALLGQIVFTVPETLPKLEAIIHPIVAQFTNVLITRAKQRVVVVEAIKLLESSLLDGMDAVWVVDAAPENQLRRLVEKRKMPPDEARRRMAAQPPQAQKIARANVVIKNDSSVEETWKQVQAAWNDMTKALTSGLPVRTAGLPGVRTGQTGPLPAAPRATGPLTARPPQNAPAANPSTAPTTPKPPAGGQPPPTVRPRPAPPAGDMTLPVPPQEMGERRPAPAQQPVELVIRRGMPKNAEAIARFIGAVTGKNITRQDVMAVFGPKSYLICETKNGEILAVVGWQVENLITRTDELYIDANAPRDAVIRTLLSAVEDAASQLQSEVSFIFVPNNTPNDITQAILNAGYTPLVLEQIKSLAWREVVREVMDNNSYLRGLMKQLRDEVRTPI